MSETISTTYTTTAPTLLGVWVFDPTAADTTDVSFLYVDPEGRTENLDPGATKLFLNGRTNPIVDYGVSLELDLSFSIPIPFDGNHDASVSYWRAAVAAKRTICYRDGRGRLIYGALLKISVADKIAGSLVQLSAVRVDYSPTVS